MIKNILCVFLFFTLCTSVWASDIKNLPYKNIKEGQKVKFQQAQGWTDKVKRKDSDSFVISESEIVSSDLVFDTECDYIFINKGKLLGYSEKDLKFYEFELNNNKISKNELSSDEVTNLFKDFHIIMISDFSKTTNVYKFTKKRGEEKIMLLNDTDYEFTGYGFTTNKAKFNNYFTNNALGITKKGLIQFSKNGEASQNTPWFILLVR